MTLKFPNGGHLGSTVLDFWNSPQFKESPKIQRKVIKPTKATITLAKNIKVTVTKVEGKKEFMVTSYDTN